MSLVTLSKEYCIQIGEIRLSGLEAKQKEWNTAREQALEKRRSGERERGAVCSIPMSETSSPHWENLSRVRMLMLAIRMATGDILLSPEDVVILFSI